MTAWHSSIAASLAFFLLHSYIILHSIEKGYSLRLSRATSSPINNQIISFYPSLFYLSLFLCTCEDSQKENCHDPTSTTSCISTGNVGFVLGGGCLTLPAYLLAAQTYTPCVGLLFSWYPACLACSHRGLLTCLAWAHCFYGIHYAWHALVAAFSHALRGLVVLAVSITPGVLSS